MIDGRGYSRSRISSRAIEAYLIQVIVFLICFLSSLFPVLNITDCIFYSVSDTKDWFLSRWSASGKSCYWCRWSPHILWLWYDGRNQEFYERATIRSFLFRLWEGCKKGLVFSFFLWCRFLFFFDYIKFQNMGDFPGHARSHRSWSTSTHRRLVCGMLPAWGTIFCWCFFVFLNNSLNYEKSRRL